MNMLKQGFLFICFLSLSYTVAFSQEYKEKIESEFNEYLNTIIDKQFEKSTEYLTPEFFNRIPRKILIQAMQETFNNPDVQFEIVNPKILSIDDSIKIDEKYYSLLIYSNEFKVIFNYAEKDETSERKNLRTKLTLLSLENSFGAGNVAHDQKNDLYTIQSEKKVYAISQDGKDEWKFLVLERDQKATLQKLLPQELLQNL
ncbi:hypothetical protein [Nonlabens ponticola]|uniref:Uncharacterized protein n=1 Tax=Nonlabens ponticola TaxID=2496866 RepID=A0A3S9MUL3_9FLAO|nr:hypothetical protein [Nonlabens ponticola]AZQ42869.1 hypothetical protein EJ995_00935 [Nonlabens ponticola]